MFLNPLNAIQHYSQSIKFKRLTHHHHHLKTTFEIHVSILSYPNQSLIGQMAYPHHSETPKALYFLFFFFFFFNFVIIFRRNLNRAKWVSLIVVLAREVQVIVLFLKLRIAWRKGICCCLDTPRSQSWLPNQPINLKKLNTHFKRRKLTLKTKKNSLWLTFPVWNLG